MNICAVRTIREYGGGACSYIMRTPDVIRAHEPKSEHRFRMLSVRPFKSADDEPMEKIGDYAECKHCGSIYPEDSK